MPFIDEKTEIFIIDSNSTDDTKNIIKQFPKIKYVNSPEKGRAYQMNLGAKQATGDILVFLHADTKLPSNWSNLISDTIEKGAIGGAFRINCGEGENLKFVDRLAARISNLRSYYARYPYGDQTIFCTKEAYNAVKGYDELPIMEDYEFSKKLRKHGKFRILKQSVICSYRRFRGNILKSWFTMFIIPKLYRLGFSTERLKKMYRDIR